MPRSCRSSRCSSAPSRTSFRNGSRDTRRPVMAIGVRTGRKTGAPSSAVIASALAPATDAIAAPLLDVRDLTVTFAADGQARRVVAGISYAIAPGRTLGVVGESGCGKSMTALALMGLVPPPGQVSGSARFEGREIIGQSETRWRDMRGRRVAMVFQEPMTSLNPV